MVPEARLEQTEHGLVPSGDGWFVLNARDAAWLDRGPRGVYCRFEGEPPFEQLGLRLFALEPDQPMSMYHWEADQEDFLVLQGEALLVIEGQDARSGSGTSFIARRGRRTRSSAPAPAAA